MATGVANAWVTASVRVYGPENTTMQVVRGALSPCAKGELLPFEISGSCVEDSRTIRRTRKEEDESVKPIRSVSAEAPQP